jgi:hypothetical protein
MASNTRAAMPAVLLIVGLITASRFLPGVRTVAAVGLFASGTLVGVSLMRLILALRRR